MTIMSLTDRKIIGKIPGLLIARPEGEKQGFIADLSAKTKPELQELLERQEKLLNNKLFISKLHDKGAKIQDFYDKILKEIKNKDIIEQTCESLSKLEVSKKYILEDIEWGKKHEDYEYVDSDDDNEVDTLKILAQNVAHKKQVKKLAPEKALITQKDLEDIIPHAKYLINKDKTSMYKPKFLPHKSTISDVHNPFKELTRCKKLKKFENTAATPPPSINGPVKCLTLQESLHLQQVQEEHRKEVELRHASAKLKEQFNMGASTSTAHILGSYREHQSDDDDDDTNLEQEAYDDEDEDKGTITYTVTEYI